MGAFGYRVVEQVTGAPVCSGYIRNFLADEGMPQILHRLFPPYQTAITFALGLSGANTIAFPTGRPNSGGGVAFDPRLTLAQCEADSADEGGAYTDEMRTSMGYARQAPTFTAEEQGSGARFRCAEIVFSNGHAWSPQSAATWNALCNGGSPNLRIEAPPEWQPRSGLWEAVHGYPWQRPRKLCAPLSGYDCETYDPLTVESYMHGWDATGALDWLCDLRAMGGFPITMAFLADATHSKLIAAGKFGAPILLRPGLSLYLWYEGRIWRGITRALAHRIARYCFEKAGAGYTAVRCRPLLATAPTFGPLTTYADIVPHFVAGFDAITPSQWDDVAYSAGPPIVLPRIETHDIPSWLNDGEETAGPFGSIAVYGLPSDTGTEELMWVAPFETPVSVPKDDTLRVPNKIKFWPVTT